MRENSTKQQKSIHYGSLMHLASSSSYEIQEIFGLLSHFDVEMRARERCRVLFVGSPSHIYVVNAFSSSTIKVHQPYQYQPIKDETNATNIEMQECGLPFWKGHLRGFNKTPRIEIPSDCAVLVMPKRICTHQKNTWATGIRLDDVHQYICIFDLRPDGMISK